MKNRGFKKGDFTVYVTIGKDTKGNDSFVGTMYDKTEKLIMPVYSTISHFDCALKGIAYMRTLNDMPSNYKLKVAV